MNTKTVLLIIAGATTSGLLVTLCALYLWHNRPEMLGLPPNPPPQVAGADSVKVVSEADLLRAKSDSLERVLHSVSDSLSHVSGSLNSLQSQHKAMVDQYENAKKEQQKKDLAQRDSTRLKNLQIAAEMYEKAQASEVAKILAGSDKSYSASVLKLMKRKSAAKVLELMPTKTAVDISKIMASN